MVNTLHFQLCSFIKKRLEYWINLLKCVNLLSHRNKSHLHYTLLIFCDCTYLPTIYFHYNEVVLFIDISAFYPINPFKKKFAWKTVHLIISG